MKAATMRIVTPAIFLIVLFKPALQYGQVTFTRDFEVWNEYSMHNFQQTSDGGYIISTDAMFEMDPAAYLGKGFLIKLNSSGSTQWTKEYIKTGPYIKPRDGCPVFQCSDGGFIMASAFYTLYGNAQMRLMRTDASGNLLWSRLFPGFGVSIGYCVRQTSDGGYVVAGSTTDPQTMLSHAYLLKTDASGNPQFGKVLIEPVGYTGVAYSIRQSSDGGFVFCGMDEWKALIGKLDAQGNLLWHKKVEPMGEFYDVIEQNGTYTAVGDLSSGNMLNMCIMNFSTSGTVNWSKFYSDGGSVTGYTLMEMNGGDLIIAGNATSANYTFLQKVDPTGNMIWAQGFSAYSVPPVGIATSDGGFALLRTSMAMFVCVNKTDNMGNTACSAGLLPLNANVVSFNLDADLTVMDSMPFLADTVTLRDRVLNENTNCYTDSTLPLPCEDSVFIPNVFTPNGDGMNDLFKDVVFTCGEYHMLIYDRWGTLVFESKYPNVHWSGNTLNGSKAVDGTYYYVLKTSKNSYKGFLTLLR